ncbi:imm11 family protein [Ruegeria sp. HKCCD8929]|uniref:imm11 family protein n=1 Tax=Ruegeria sp. HKCCD8929 TaxID=2683006 RepID=UPI0014880E1C|nr:DUF1629 domain-containing protein [Ruegeria sp. HKCCD8929]
MTKKPMIWISDAMKSASSLRGFHPDLWFTDESRTVDAMKRNAMGEPLPAERFPKEMYAEYKDKREKKQPDLFSAGGFWTVSAACAEVLCRFDLGQGSLYPVRLFQHDRSTPVEGEYYCVNFGAQKTAVLTDQSSRIKKPYENYDIWQPPLAMQDNDISVRSSSLSGPDLWIDPQMRDAFFLSDALAQALRAAKVSRPFKLRKCVVV